MPTVAECEMVREVAALVGEAEAVADVEVDETPVAVPEAEAVEFDPGPPENDPPVLMPAASS